MVRTVPIRLNEEEFLECKAIKNQYKKLSWDKAFLKFFRASKLDVPEVEIKKSVEKKVEEVPEEIEESIKEPVEEEVKPIKKIDLGILNYE